MTPTVLRVPRGFLLASRAFEDQIAGILARCYRHVCADEVGQAHSCLWLAWKHFKPHRGIIPRAWPALESISPGNYYHRRELYRVEYPSAHHLIDELGREALRLAIRLDGLERAHNLMGYLHRGLNLLRSHADLFDFSPSEIRESLRVERRRMRELKQYLRRVRG